MARGIYKRGAIYWLRYAGVDGQTIRESTCSNKFKEAEILLLKRKQTINEGCQPISRSINYTFKDLAEEYLKWAERQKCYRVKKGHIFRFLSMFGKLPLNNFNTLLVEKLQTEKIKKGYKPATVNRSIATLKHMFSKGTEWEMCSEESLKKVHKVKMLKENNRRLRYLSEEEWQNLISACPHHLMPIVITALHTGMRKTEILSLKWSNIDLKNGFILLDDTKNGERREIPINETLRETLQTIIRRLDVPYVFHDTSTGKPYGDVKKAFASTLRKAGIEQFHFHDLRHTFASYLVMKGIDITTVKELLGHKSLDMTLRYAHLAPDHKKNAVKVLDIKKSTAQLLHNLA